MPLAEQQSSLFEDIKRLIDQSRQKVAATVNAELTLLYWNVAWRIKKDVLNNNRAGYGKQVVAVLSARLTAELGRGWSERQLWNSLRTAEIFADQNFCIRCVQN